MPGFSDKYVKNFDPNALLELLAIAKQLRDAIERGDVEKLKALESQKSLLLMLLEYLVLNIDNPNFDKSLIQFLEKFLNIRLKKRKKELEEEQEEQEELSKEEKENRRLIICHEIYKIFNPNRVAGETQMQNFINNVRVRGIKYALRHEGAKYIDSFDRDELQAVENNKPSFVEFLAKQGFKGGGRGLK